MSKEKAQIFISYVNFKYYNCFKIEYVSNEKVYVGYIYKIKKKRNALIVYNVFRVCACACVSEFIWLPRYLVSVILLSPTRLSSR